jgi:hypothetical protein
MECTKEADPRDDGTRQPSEWEPRVLVLVLRVQVQVVVTFARQSPAYDLHLGLHGYRTLLLYRETTATLRKN